MDSPIPDTMMDSPLPMDSPLGSEFGSQRDSLSSQIGRSPARPAVRANRPQNIIGMAPLDDEHKNDMLSSSMIGGNGEVIWGTDINIETAAKSFKNFITNYKTPHGDFKYVQLIEESIMSREFNLNLDTRTLYDFNATLYRQLRLFPQEMIPIFDMIVNTFAKERFPDELEEAMQDAGGDVNLTVRPFNLRDVRSMRDMNPEDVDSLVSIRGMVIRTTPIIPDIQEAFFRCTVCHQTQVANIDMGRICEPTLCPNPQCQSKLSFELIHNRSKFLDKQMVKIQETVEAIPDGETPQTIDCYCYDNLVDVCRPGDRVQITGVYRAQAIRVNPRQRAVESVYRTFLDAVHFQKIGKNQFSVEAPENEADETLPEFNEGDTALDEHKAMEDRIKELGSREDIIDILVKSFAPSVWEMDDVKLGILCQLFGGSRKDFTEVGGGKFRSQLNVLLCGDPGTSKSQLLQYVHRVAPRGIYTSGKGSSAVGLTAYITKDPDTKEIILESGALVLSDRGICCIDEFDKMGDSARSILHEVMEQQTISVAKAGIICELNARTSILAAANPIESRYNPNKSVVENIDLPPTLISRFDLIYLILDRPNDLLDRRLARHIISLYHDETERMDVDDRDMLDTKTFMEYISYSRREFNPKLTDEAAEKLVTGYCEMRSIGRNAGRKIITATPRQLESLIRLSEAMARMRHSETVTSDDVDSAIRLHKVATLQAATDPKTGAIDMDVITTGRSREEEDALKLICEGLIEVLRTYRRKTIRQSTLLKKYNDFISDNPKLQAIGVQELDKAVLNLERQGRLRPGDRMSDDPVITITTSVAS